MINIRNERESMITDPTDIKRMIREYYKYFCAHKFDTLDDMNTFPERYK